MYYVYILRSINSPEQVYVGYTEHITSRLAKHNAGSTFHTAKYIPWQLEMYLAFNNKDKAMEFETYLKSHSGRAFRDKRFL